jgi:hypothetical protein
MKIPEYIPPYTIDEAVNIAFEKLRHLGIKRDYLRNKIRDIAFFHETTLQMFVRELDLETLMYHEELEQIK